VPDLFLFVIVTFLFHCPMLTFHTHRSALMRCMNLLIWCDVCTSASWT